MKRRVAVGLGVSLFNPRFLAALATGAALVAACARPSDGKRSSKAQYGEPVGIDLAAKGPVPALALGVAVTVGRDPTPSVGSIAGAVHAAALGCQAFLEAMKAGKTARLELGARNGVFESLGAAPDEVGGACMSAALGGKAVKMDKPDPLDVIVELRQGTTLPVNKP